MGSSHATCEKRREGSRKFSIEDYTQPINLIATSQFKPRVPESDHLINGRVREGKGMVDYQTSATTG